MARTTVATWVSLRGIVVGQRYLLLVAMFSLLFTMVKTNGDYALAHVVEEGAKAAVAAGAIRPNGVQDYIGSVFASYSFWVDMITLVIQAFVVSRVVKHLGLGFAFLVLQQDATSMRCYE